MQVSAGAGGAQSSVSAPGQAGVQVPQPQITPLFMISLLFKVSAGAPMAGAQVSVSPPPGNMQMNVNMGMPQMNINMNMGGVLVSAGTPPPQAQQVPFMLSLESNSLTFSTETTLQLL